MSVAWLNLQEMDEIELLQRRIGEALRAARLRFGSTQVKAAEAADVTREYWGHVETEGRNLTVATVVKLAQAVGSSFRQIVLEATGTKNLSPKRKIFRKARKPATK